MDSYDERLTQRLEATAALESAYVHHFGPEAAKYDRWARLWRNGWQEVLTNPAPTPTYQPRGLPLDAEGHIISGGTGVDGELLPPPLSHYSPKFLFAVAQEIANGGPQLVAAISDILAEADEVDCDHLTKTVDELTTYLNNYALRCIDGSGRVTRIGQLDPAQTENFFRNWNEEQPGNDVFIARPGIAISGRPVLPHEVASNVLQTVQRQIQARRVGYAKPAQLLAALATQKPDKKKLSLPAVALTLIYEGKYLQRGNKANELALQAGHNSGDSLYNQYSKYSTDSNRIGFDNETARKGRKMIERIREALPGLSSKAKQKAESEIIMIEARIA